MSAKAFVSLREASCFEAWLTTSESLCHGMFVEVVALLHKNRQFPDKFFPVVLKDVTSGMTKAGHSLDSVSIVRGLVVAFVLANQRLPVPARA